MYGTNGNAHNVHFHVTGRCEDVSVFGQRYNTFLTTDSMAAAEIKLATVADNMGKSGVTVRKVTPNEYIFGENTANMDGSLKLTGCYAGCTCDLYANMLRSK